MSTDLPRYSERLVEAFLDEGPIRMSDRLFDAIVDDIYTTRQQGRRALWRYRSMNRTALAAAVIVVVVAVAGLAVATIRAPGTDVGNQPSPVPSATPAPSPTPAPAIGATLPGSGSVMAVNEFTEPFTFVMPVFPKDGSTAVRGEALDAVGGAAMKGYGLLSALWGGVTFHDDETLPADMCRPSKAIIQDVPATPADVGRWLGTGSGLAVSAPVTLTVDGREAMVWDTETAAGCDKTADRPSPWFGAGEHHRIYAVPTGTDTILVITWGVDWGNGSEEYLDEVNAAADELVRSMNFAD